MNASDSDDRTPGEENPAGEAPRVTVNGEVHALPAGTASVPVLLRHLGFDPEQPGLAVAVAGAVVQRRNWAETSLTGGETVEVITAQQGG